MPKQTLYFTQSAEMSLSSVRYCTTLGNAQMHRERVKRAIPSRRKNEPVMPSAPDLIEFF